MYSEDDLLNEIRKVSNKKCDGKTPKMEDMKKYGAFSISPFKTTYGSWNNAVKEAGFEPNINTDIDFDELLSDLERVSENHFDGKVPKREEYNRHSKYSSSTFERYFGSWNKALEKCGFKELNKNYDVSKQEMGEELERVSREYFDGGRPTSRIMEENGKYSVDLYQDNFGSWSDALEYFDFKRYPSKEDHPLWTGGHDVYYGPSWTKQRNKTLIRDDFCCVVCGKDDYKNKDVPDIHHIKPARKWNVEEEHEEMNSLNNLVSLCPSCHSRFEGKWQECSANAFVEKCENYLNSKK